MPLRCCIKVKGKKSAFHLSNSRSSASKDVVSVQSLHLENNAHFTMDFFVGWNLTLWAFCENRWVAANERVVANRLSALIIR